MTIADAVVAELLTGQQHRVVMRNIGHGLAVSCSCLGRAAGRSRKLIELREGTFPAADAIAAWRTWHEREGISL